MPFVRCYLLFFLLFFSLPAEAGKRVALLVGNGAYGGDADLGSPPINDAAGVESKLKKLGFQTIFKVTNASKREMVDKVQSFGQALAGAELALFYYSGHGVQYGGHNYLLPVGSQIQGAADLEFEAFDIDRVVQQMAEGGSQINVVILDACRNNPFRRWFKGAATRGLARIDSAGVRGSIVAYATQPGNVAENGQSGNSPYTKHLLTYLDQPGMSLQEMFSEVGMKVMGETGGRQQPWYSTSPMPKFCLAGCQQVADLRVDPPPPPPPPKTDMPFVLVPKGCFQMGSNDYSDEKPVHEVCVNTFEIGKHEVTQGQWKAVMGSNPSHFSSCGDDCPVEKVSWNDVQEFIQKLNARGQGGYRLPTEAEWEYACRSGGKPEKYCGGNDIDRLAWYDGNSGNKTRPVGQKAANGLGIYDMSGNVSEWVSDWYDRKYYANSPRENPQGASRGSSRVIRGGSWYSIPAFVRSAYRDIGGPGDRHYNLGFRLTRNVP